MLIKEINMVSTHAKQAMAEVQVCINFTMGWVVNISGYRLFAFECGYQPYVTASLNLQ